MQPLIVSYYTDSYAPVAERYLLPSLWRLGLDADVRRAPDFPTWERACQHKAQVIAEAYASGRSVLWLDADAVLWSDPLPYLSGLVGDVAAHRLNGELLSGTLWLSGGREIVTHLIDKWMAINAASPGEWDQRTLDTAIAATPGLSVDELPPEYCCIFDTHRVIHPGIVPVVEHHQASRLMKRRVIRCDA